MTKPVRPMDEAIILCGGLGSRLQDLAADRPKALLEVCARPFVEWLLIGLARRDGMRHVILATGHLGEMVERHFGDRPWCGLRLSYSREMHPLGTGGALRVAAALTEAPQLLVLNGDTYCRYDSSRLLDTHTKKSASATLWLSRLYALDGFGNVEIDANGSVLEFNEKAVTQSSGLASAGVYVIERDVLAGIQIGRAVSLEREVFPSLVGRGLYGVVGEGAFVDIGTPESLNQAGETLANELGGLDCN